MPSYFYYLKFELYDTPSPTTTTKESPDHGRGGKLPARSTKDLWLPAPDTDIFGNLPAHPSRLSKAHQTSRPQPSPLQHLDLSYRPASYGLASQDRATTSGTNVIDCGTSRGPVDEVVDRNFEFLTQRQWKARAQSFPPPPALAAIRPDTAVQDWRFGRVSIESLDLVKSKGQGNEKMAGDAGTGEGGPHAATGIGPTFNNRGTSTQAEYLPFDTKNTEVGWGVVHFYRDEEESPSLKQPITEQQGGQGAEDDDCTTLCIPSVPSYLMPRDLLGFIGQQWQEGISHYRIVSTEQMNRNLVLLKFRNAKRAKEWQKQFNGRPLGDTGQIGQVVFVKSITFETPPKPDGDFPDLRQDPFTPSTSGAMSSSMKPFPPPTPNLIELPTCAVCLERMDDTTGLMTIACQHVFHCKCLESWKSAGCPICRHTSESQDPSNPYSQPFGSEVSNLCSVCDCADDLWICLICGRVGCGRYKGGHAKDHWKETAHSFALELETQHVWDYAGDTWVHRLIRDKGDGKLVELPGTTGQQQQQQHAGHVAGEPPPYEDLVPRAKLDNIGHEYSHLLTSQLESQRTYFEEMLSKVADKASRASSTADAASKQVEMLRAENDSLRVELARLRDETVPQLERDGERDRKRAERAQELARELGKAVQEEKEISRGLMKRVEHDKGEVAALRAQDAGLKEKVVELEEMNRDLSMFISGQEKLRELESEGKVDAEEVAEGTASVPDRKGKGKGRRGKK